jgi:adenosine 3'-phospho 5'-phosphosulfate transporter B2
MAFKYGESDTSPGENFKNSQFLVFVNRILAFTVAVLYIQFTKQPRHVAPLYKYSYSSFSNIMSSWFQYESLKFVSFPTQVLAKSCKVIPVMFMGKVVSNKSFQMYEYVTALMISFGVGIFMLTSGDSVKDDSPNTTFSGIIILAGYLLFDAFTSNWQGELFVQYKMSSIQMMAGVNFFSVIFTTVSLIEQGGFFESSAFMIKYPEFVFHCVILSICSAIGQLFIFYTIGQFGAVVFTIIMVLRQGFAILLSCIIYGHSVSIWGILGIILVFSAIFIRQYLSNLYKRKAVAKTVESLEKVVVTDSRPTNT